MTLQTHAEQAPNPDSRVTLSDAARSLGVPLPKVDWRLTELDRRTAETMVEPWPRSSGGSGWARCGPSPGSPARTGPRHMSRLLSPHGHHPARERDPRTSVVDRDGQVHGVAGLFVAGSSVFPAAGFVNPTLTIAALAIRLSDHLQAALP